MTLVKELQKAIDAGKITKIALADAADLSRMQIHRILTGENKPSLEKATKLAKAIGLEIVLRKPAKR